MYMSLNKIMRSARTKAAVAVMMMTAMLASTAIAAPSVNLADGRTSVVLSSEFLTALGTLGLSATALGDGTLRSGIASFPVSGGVVDLQNAKGEINHTGGLVLTSRTARVELSSFNIDTTGAVPVLTGLVTANGNFLGRVALFTLQLPALTLPLQPAAFNTIFIPNVKALLTSEAAAALNGVFGTTALAGGFNVGTASVFAVGQPGERGPFMTRPSHR